MAQNLTSDEIYEKVFNVDFKGYSAKEVDEFLDLVLQDYESFQKQVKEQQSLLERYELTVNQQKKRIEELERKEQTTPNLSASSSQLDLIRRVSKLEEIVYNNR